MRVAIVNTLYPPTNVGGAERSVAVLAEALAATGDEVHVIALDDIKAASIEVVTGVTVHRLPHGNLYWPFADDRPALARRIGWQAKDRGMAAVTADVRKLLQDLRPDILHTNNLTGFGSGVIPIARDLCIPVIHTLRDFSLLCARASLFRSGKDCKARCLSCRVLTGPRMKAARDVQIVVGNSEYMVTRHRAEGLFGKTPARTIFNAVPGISAASADAGEASSPTLRIGFLGAVKPEKGIEELLEACRSLPASGWTLTIGGKGDGGYVNALKARHAGLPIMWSGFVAADRFYEEVDLVVIPSIWPEPMPRVLIEAIAHGLPVFVSDAGGAPEVAALHAGATVYPRRDTQRLGELLAASIRERPARVAPDMPIVEKFGTGRLVAEYREAYRDAIAELCDA